MKSLTVKELKPNENVTTVFLVQSKEIRQKRTGEPYLSLILSDRSGEIEAKMWDNVAEVMDTFDRDNFVKVKGLMQVYNNRPQFTIHKMRRLGDHEVTLADFLPSSQRDPEEMWAELRAIVSSLDNVHVRSLLDAFLDDPEIASRYKVAPAAKSIHHAYRGGLLEHVLSITNLARIVSPHYKADVSLVIAGTVLHDIGKIYELTYERGFGYSAEGQLVGHITIATRMFYDKLRAFPEFPMELRHLVEHLILSHHGLLEFGSPKVPMFPEALLLHYLDDLDSKMECMRALTEQDPQGEGFFTRYSSSMERVALRKERYLNGQSTPVQPCPISPSTSPVSPTPEEVWPKTSDSYALPDVAWSPSPGSAQSSSQPKPKPSPASNSLFGDKLKQALHDERK